MNDVFYVGIDLGTTNTVVAYIDEDDNPQLLEFGEMGEFFLPSVLYVDEDEQTTLVGRIALSKGAADPTRLIRSSKRKMRFRDYSYPDSEQRHSFTMKLRPKDVTTKILEEVRRTLIERGLCNEETEIYTVITVPDNWYHPAQEDTEEAGKRAGFIVMDKLSEPIAAAYHYITQRIQNQDRILVCDFGGGTLDITFLKPNEQGNNYIPYGHGGEAELGGDDFDKHIVKEFQRYILEEVGIDLTEQATSGLSPMEYNVVNSKLRDAAEKAKIDLSRFSKPDAENRPTSRTSVTILNLLKVGGKSWTFDYVLTLKRFNECCAKVYEDFQKAFREMFSKNQKTDGSESVSAEEVTMVLLVGGSCHIPKVRMLLKEMFPQANLRIGDLSNAVAYGAAIYAQSCLIPEDEQTEELPIQRTSGANDLGVAVIEMVNGRPQKVFDTIIPKDSLLPIRKRRPYPPFRDYEEKIPVEIYERKAGTEGNSLSNCNYWETIMLCDFIPGLRSETEVEVIFELDINNKLTVTAIYHDKDGVEIPIRKEIDKTAKPMPNLSFAQPMDIFFLLDSSFSMRAPVPNMGISTLSAVRRAFQELVTHIIDTSCQKIGVITFGMEENHQMIQALTNNPDLLMEKVNKIEPKDTATCVGGAIELATQELLKVQDKRRRKAILILTDGLFTDQPKENLTKLTDEAKQLGISVVVITADPNRRLGNNVDLKNLVSLDNERKPMSYYATDLTKLQDLFGDIMDGLSKL
ncbi:MAG: Hsp70 family protein [Oscillospiraceae bacterium]